MVERNFSWRLGWHGVRNECMQVDDDALKTK